MICKIQKHYEEQWFQDKSSYEKAKLQKNVSVNKLHDLRECKITISKENNFRLSYPTIQLNCKKYSINKSHDLQKYKIIMDNNNFRVSYPTMQLSCKNVSAIKLQDLQIYKIIMMNNNLG